MWLMGVNERRGLQVRSGLRPAGQYRRLACALSVMGTLREGGLQDEHDLTCV